MGEAQKSAFGLSDTASLEEDAHSYVDVQIGDQQFARALSSILHGVELRHGGCLGLSRFPGKILLGLL